MPVEKRQTEGNKSMNTKKNKGWAVAVGLILVFSLLAGINLYRGFARKQADSKAVETVAVKVARAVIGRIDQHIERTADIVPGEQVLVLSKVPGKVIEQILVEEGQQVRKGDLIATVEQDLIKARLEEVGAELASARAALVQAEAKLSVLAQDRRRIKALLAEKAVSRQKYDHIEAEYRAATAAADLARAKIRKARAVLRRLRVLARDHRVQAPIDGLVIKRHLDPGNIAAPGRPIVTLADISTVKVVTSVSEKDLAHVRPGTPVTVVVDAFGNREFAGKVSLVGTTVDPATRTARIEIRLPNKDGRLKPGMFAHVAIHLPSREALVVPAQALERVPGTGQPFVYTVQDGRAVMHNVVAGSSRQGMVEIKAGLQAGALVVTEGQQRLREAVPVKVVNQEAVAGSREAGK